jgi:hypothetical protein
MPTKEWLLVSSSMDTIGPRQNSARYGTPMARLFFARRLGQDIALIRKIRHVGRIPAFHVQIASCKRVLFYNTQLFRFTRITIIAGSPCIYILYIHIPITTHCIPVYLMTGSIFYWQCRHVSINDWMAMATYLLVRFPSTCQDDVVGGIHLLPSSLPGVLGLSHLYFICGL